MIGFSAPKIAIPIKRFLVHIYANIYYFQNISEQARSYAVSNLKLSNRLWKNDL